MKTPREFLATVGMTAAICLGLPAASLAETIELRIQATLKVARLASGDSLPVPWRESQKVDVVIEFESDQAGLRSRRPELISNALVKDIAFHKVDYRVRFRSPMVATFRAGAFSVGNGMVAFGIDPFGCGDGYRRRLLTSMGEGSVIETTAGRRYLPARFVMTQMGFDNPREPLGKVLERFVNQAAAGQTKLAVQLRSELPGQLTGPAMVFALAEPKLSVISDED